MKLPRRFLPLWILLPSAVVAWVLIMLRPEPETTVPQRPRPVIEVIPVQPEQIRLTVEAQGTVRARTRTVLTNEVTGRVVWTSPDFQEGAFVQKDQKLLRLDQADYRANLAARRTELAEAQLNLEREQANAAQARQEWQDIGQGEPTPLALREPQLARAQAAVASTEAAVARAQRDLERTVLRAPYEGRILSTDVDIGQYVGAPGTRLTEIFAVDYAEIDLPLNDRQMALMEIPMHYRSGVTGSPAPEATVRARYGGKHYSWQGIVDRSVGTVNPRSRLYMVIARVDDPYGRREPGKPPLKIGMFVDVAIEGVTLKKAFRLPRSALAEEETVLIVDAEDNLRRRDVEVVQAGVEEVVIRGGLEAGDRVVVSPVEYVAEGMPVRPVEADNKKQLAGRIEKSDTNQKKKNTGGSGGSDKSGTALKGGASR